MKKLLLILTLLGYSFLLNAKQIDVSKATSVAKNFVSKTTSLRSFSNGYQLNLVKTEKTRINNQSLNAYYVFNISSGGFIIIAADDLVKPVLAYSTESSFNIKEIPSSIQFYFNQLNQEIKAVLTENNTSQQSENEWDYYSNSSSPRSGNLGVNTMSSVSPLLTTKWNQSGGYQKFCPSYTGCVGTAFAQILKYYNYPSMGMGYKSYSNNIYGTQAANFGATSYNWADMPNQLSSNTPVVNIDAIATLMYHAGVSIDMDYTPTGSSAFPSKVVNALKNTFGYASSATIINRSSYTLQSWTNKIKAELDASRVVMHTGYCPNPVAGHAFVVDGYDETGLYHFNWGWGGSYNGYFQLSNLATGSYTWNQNQQLIIGITPGTTTNYKLALDADITSPNTATIGNTVIVTSTIKNTGTTSASGSVMVALFNDKNEWVSTIQTLSNKVISAGATATYTFTNYNLSVLPGKYNLGVYFAQNGVTTSWKLVASGNYTNPKLITAKPNNTLSINSTFACTPSTTLYQSDSCLVKVAIKNTATSSFTGDIKAAIYSASGVLKKDIQIKLANTITQGNSVVYEFKTSSLSSLTPGSYYIAVQIKKNGTSQYVYLNAQSGYSASQRIIIKKTIVVNNISSREENSTEIEEEKNSITIYPNPVASELTINTNTISEKTITMMDLNGRVVRQVIATNEMITILPVLELNNGIYIISILEGDKQKTYKIIKQ